MRRWGMATKPQAETSVSRHASLAQLCLRAFALALPRARGALTLVLPARFFRSASVAFPGGFASNLFEK